ncbi:MAG: TrkA family potassium uptake protein [Tissierellaceae bacterium]|nr:TrkA family potassium uptake protein [Tissierellaceae bacterium]
MKQFAVIGCGRFGSSVAKTLYNEGHDVLVIDKDPVIVQEIADQVTHAVQVDTIDESALTSLGLTNFDVVIVSIGADIQASILTTLICKEIGVKRIIAKAQTEIHGRLLNKVGADSVVFPERDMGVRVAHNLVSPSILDHIELSPDYSIVEISVLDEWEGKSLLDLRLPSKYGVNILAIKHKNGINISPNADYKIAQGDILVVIGNNKDLSKFEKRI